MQGRFSGTAGARFVRHARKALEGDIRRAALRAVALCVLAAGGGVFLLMAGYMRLARVYAPETSALLMAGGLLAAALLAWVLPAGASGARGDAGSPRPAGDALREVEELARDNPLPAHIMAFALGMLCTARPEMARAVYDLLDKEEE